MGVVAKERVDLPDDLQALKEIASRYKALLDEREALLEEKEALLQERTALLAERDTTIAQLRHRIDVLSRALFEPRSERRPIWKPTDQPGQGWLLFPDLIERAERVADKTGQRGSVEITRVGKPRKKGGRRKKYPSHLPVIRTTFELPEDDRNCVCGHELHEIGEEVTRELERLEITVVHEIARKKYACRACTDGVTTAEGPPRVIPKGQLGVGFLSHVIVERFAHHMPYHRQEKKYAAEGLDLSRSVLWRSTHRCAEQLKPIYEELVRQVLASDAIHTDDTAVTLQVSRTGGRRQARIWVYRDLEGRQVFDFTQSRGRDGPARLLEEYRGYVIADAYPLYDVFFGPEKATEVGCWSHARRYFVRAETSDPTLAKEAISKIGLLYDVERCAKELSMGPEEVFALRQELSLPLLEDFETWMKARRLEVLDKSPMARAIDHALSNWEALKRYCEDGRLPIDNNPAERSLRSVAVGRKNWNFIGNEKGGWTAAILFSLVETAKAAGVDPRTYLEDVLLRVGTEEDVSSLTPHGWKERWEPKVKAHRQDLLERLMGRAGARK